MESVIPGRAKREPGNQTLIPNFHLDSGSARNASVPE